MKKLFLIISALYLSACAMAPVSNLYTGRSLGKGGINLDVGTLGTTGAGGTTVSGIPVIKFDVGLSDNLDLGVHYEIFNFGGILKYSLVNNRSGFSWALAASAGSVTGGSFWYGGTVFSYKGSFFEPYIIARYNSVSWSSVPVTSGSISFNTPATTFAYWYYTGGTMMWFSEKIGLGLEYSTPGSFTNGVSLSSSGFWAAAFMFRF